MLYAMTCGFKKMTGRFVMNNSFAQHFKAYANSHKNVVEFVRDELGSFFGLFHFGIRLAGLDCPSMPITGLVIHSIVMNACLSNTIEPIKLAGDPWRHLFGHAPLATEVGLWRQSGGSA